MTNQLSVNRYNETENKMLSLISKYKSPNHVSDTQFTELLNISELSYEMNIIL